MEPEVEKETILSLIMSLPTLNFRWNGKLSRAETGIFGVSKKERVIKHYQTGPEIQVLDNERHPDSFNKPNYHQAGALYDMVQPTQNVCKLAGEWNHVFISIDYNANKGSVKLNDLEIVTFPLRERMGCSGGRLQV